MSLIDTFKQNKYELIGSIIFLIIGIICSFKMSSSPKEQLEDVSGKATGKKQGLIAGIILGYGLFIILVGMVYFD